MTAFFSINLVILRVSKSAKEVLNVRQLTGHASWSGGMLMESSR